MALIYRINPDIDIPIYTQLVDMIRADIQSGALPAGSKLPTVRELSDQCSIARGTVMRAYDELEQMGVIEKIQGRGTFVCAQQEEITGRKDRAMAAIDTMLDTLEQLNFSRTEMNIFLSLKLRERESAASSVKLAVVECNYEVLNEISEQLRGLGDVDVFAFHLDEVRAYPYRLNNDFDLIVVSAAHAEELQRLLPDGTSLTKAMLRLTPRSVSRLVRLPDGSNIGVLCQSKRFGRLAATACADYCETADVDTPALFGTDLKSYLVGKTALLVPENCKRYCGESEAALIREFEKQHPVVSCEYRIDDGSMMYIEDRINRIREKK